MPDDTRTPLEQALEALGESDGGGAEGVADDGADEGGSPPGQHDGAGAGEGGREQGGQGRQEEAGKAPPESATVKLPDGSEVELTVEALSQAVHLGLLAGDESTVRDVQMLERFANENPNAAKVMRALAANPGMAERVAEALGMSADGGAEGQEDPREKELRELRAENERLKAGGKSEGGDPWESFKADVKKSAEKYPSLQGKDVETVAELVHSKMARGISKNEALLQVSRMNVRQATDDAERKAAKAKTQRAMRGAGRGGRSATSVSPPKSFSANDLASGAVRKAAEAFLRQSD